MHGLRGGSLRQVQAQQHSHNLGRAVALAHAHQVRHQLHRLPRDAPLRIGRQEQPYSILALPRHVCIVVSHAWDNCLWQAQ